MTVSSKPSKQRYEYFNAPLHKRHKYFNAKLSKELAKELGVKRLPVRKGDIVRIMRGDWAGHEGKVVRVDHQKVAIFVEGVTMKKADGTPVYYPIHPSKVMIIKLDLSDKLRKKIIERRKKGEVKITEEVAEEKKKEEPTKEGDKEEGVKSGDSSTQGGSE